MSWTGLEKFASALCSLAIVVAFDTDETELLLKAKAKKRPAKNRKVFTINLLLTIRLSMSRYIQFEVCNERAD
jgi:hypothetical protein